MVALLLFHGSSSCPHMLFTPVSMGEHARRISFQCKCSEIIYLTRDACITVPKVSVESKVRVSENPFKKKSSLNLVVMQPFYSCFLFCFVSFNRCLSSCSIRACLRRHPFGLLGRDCTTSWLFRPARPRRQICTRCPQRLLLRCPI